LLQKRITISKTLYLSPYLLGYDTFYFSKTSKSPHPSECFL
jgi:hypothetical protein